MPLPDKNLLKEESETVVKQSCVNEKSMLEENDQATANVHTYSTTVVAELCENTAHIGQETLQKSSKIESNDTNMVQSVHTENNGTSLSMIASMYNSDEEIDINENESDKIDKTENQSSNETDKTENKSSDKTDETNNKFTAPINQTHILQQYRTVVLSSNEDTDSEDESSSSSSSSSSKSSSDSSDSDSDTIAKNKKKNSKKDDKVNTANKTKQIKTEFDELPPIEDLQISVSEDSCVLFGEIDKIVEQLVIVKPLPLKPTLNLETVLFLDRGQKALGKIFDVFGTVSEPYYCIRFNNSEHIKQNKIEARLLVYYCPNTEYTLLIFLHEMIKLKACDAELGDDEPPEFSDDEEEQAYYRNLNQKNSSAESTADSSISYKRQRTSGPSQKPKRGWRSNPWNRNARFQRQLSQRNSNRFNHTYNNNWQQGYAYQSNAYWQSVSQHFTSNRLHSDDMSQYHEGQPNFQTCNMHQYPRARTSSRFLPHFLMNRSQYSNASSSWNAVPYPISVQSSMSTHMTTSWSSSSVTPSVPAPSSSLPPVSPLSSSSWLSPSSSSLSLPTSSSPSSTKTTTSNNCDMT